MPKRRCNNQNRNLQPGKKTRRNGNLEAQPLDVTIDHVASGIPSDTSFTSSIVNLDETKESDLKQMIFDINALKDTVRKQQEAITVMTNQIDFLHCLKNLYIYGTTLIIAEGNVP